jgi:hypothetical protein
MKINVDAALPKKYKESGSDSDCEGWRSHFLGCLGSIALEGLSEAWLKHLHVVKASLSRLT